MIAILRGLPVDETVDLTIKCWEAGIHLVEVPYQSDVSLKAISALAPLTNGEDRFIGAGTVCTADEAHAVADAGAQFCISPGFFPESIAAAADRSIPYLPGVATATEVHAALALGLDVQKFFPADSLSPATISTLAGPFPQVRFVVVGGITVDNARSFLDAGALAVGVGSALTRSPSAVESFSSLAAPAL